MKTLKENTIIPKNVGSKDSKTVFTATTPADRDRSEYISLSKRMVGRNLFFDYKYEEDGGEKDGKIRLVVPDLDDDAIKAFVIDEINKELSK